MKGEKTFPDKTKVEEFITSGPTILNVVLQVVEMKAKHKKTVKV